jgi:predicted dehydrogenase
VKSAARPLRIGVAGLAALYWPITIARGIAARSDARLVAFSTLGVGDGEIERHLGMRPGEYARTFGAKPYRDLDDMMGTERLDAVALCTRHTWHARWVERLAPFGADIFVAKTFATTGADAERIVAAGRKHRVRIAVGPSARFLPWFAAVRTAVDAGRIGTPFALRIGHHHGTLDVFRRGDFYRDPREGGPELSLGWYLVDLAMQLLKQPVSRVSAEYGTYTTPDSPFMDCGRLTLRMADGAMASCDMYFCNRFAFPSWEMEMTGDKGALLVRQSCGDPSATKVVLLTRSGRRELALPARSPDWELFWIDEFRARRTPSVSAEYAAEVTRVCLAAREAARKGSVVGCGPAPRSRAPHRRAVPRRPDSPRRPLTRPSTRRPAPGRAR